jgi:hypothetical protein
MPKARKRTCLVSRGELHKERSCDFRQVPVHEGLSSEDNRDKWKFALLGQLISDHADRGEAQGLMRFHLAHGMLLAPFYAFEAHSGFSPPP